MSSVNLSPAAAGLFRRALWPLAIAILLLMVGCASKLEDYGKFKDMEARLQLCQERWITTQAIWSLLMPAGEAKEVWAKSNKANSYSPFRLSRDSYLSQYFPSLLMTSWDSGHIGMTGRVCSFSLQKSAARGKYADWSSWSGVGSPDDVVRMQDYTYWPAGRDGDISGLISFLAEYYQGQVLLQGSVKEGGNPGNGALIIFPDSVGYVYVRFLEFNHAGRDKKYDRVAIDIFLPGNETAPALRRLSQTQLAALNRELRDMSGSARINHPFHARDIENARIDKLRAGGTVTMAPWPADFSGVMLSELSKLFIRDRSLLDQQIAARNRAQETESDRWQAEAEGNSYREALSGALTEVVQEHGDLYGSMQQQTRQAVGNVISMSGGGGGSYQSAPSPQAIREQREQAQREAIDESRRTRYGAKQVELKRCQAIGGRWGGGSPDFLLDGFCDETAIKSASATAAKSSALSAICDTSSGNQVRAYSREKRQDICVTLGPVQPEAMAYCWDVNFREGYLHAYTEEKDRRYLCDGPIQKLSVSVPTVREALSMTGCNLDTVRDRAQLDRIHGDYWYHCGYGLAGQERDVWMLRKKTDARPGALEYRCREGAPSPCRVLNDSAREGLLD